jgi:hypothetical protein
LVFAAAIVTSLGFFGDATPAAAGREAYDEGSIPFTRSNAHAAWPEPTTTRLADFRAAVSLSTLAEI